VYALAAWSAEVRHVHAPALPTCAAAPAIATAPNVQDT